MNLIENLVNLFFIDEKEQSHQQEQQEQEQPEHQKVEVESEHQKVEQEKVEPEHQKVEQEKVEEQVKGLNLYIYSDFKDFLNNVKENTIVIVNDKERKRLFKRYLIEIQKNNVFTLSSLKDLKKKVGKINKVETIILESDLFKNKDDISNILQKTNYGIFYTLDNYKQIIVDLEQYSPYIKIITSDLIKDDNKFKKLIKILN